MGANNDGFYRRTSQNNERSRCDMGNRRPINQILIRMTYLLEQLAKLYVQEKVHLHGVQKSIISNCDARFTLKFWKSVQQAMRTKLKINTTFHPQKDGQTERTNQTLEDML